MNLAGMIEGEGNMKVTPINTGILIEVANGNTVLTPLQAFHVMKNLEHAIMDYCNIHDVHIDDELDPQRKTTQ